MKKEIKKLQRLRDQIKTWISSNDIKDKSQLTEARRLIETKMEQFKVCEKEAKTKTYSKEGLARASRLDPEEQAKQDCLSNLQDFIDRLNVQIEGFEADVERLLAAKQGAKKNKTELDVKDALIKKNRWHIMKLEQIVRMINNDALNYERVEDVTEDVEYYIEMNTEPDFMDTYDDDLDPYEALEIEDAPPIMEPAVVVKKEEKVEKTEKRKEKKEKKKVSTTSSIITIGRAKRKDEKDKEKPPAAAASVSPVKQPAPKPSVVPQPQPPKMASEGGTLASLLKAADSEPSKPDPQLEAQQMMQQQQHLQHQQLLQQQMQQQRMQQQQLEQRRQQESKLQQPHLRAAEVPPPGVLPLSFDTPSPADKPPVPSDPLPPAPLTTSVSEDANPRPDTGDMLSQLAALEASMKSMPTSNDRERQKAYTPRNPYPTPDAFYGPTPNPIFEDPAIFEKFHLDALFFMFYYQQGSYQQYLAARELKKQSWRFHKKYKTWFQRHEEPKLTSEDKECGTYVYFDYQGTYETKSGWCQRIKYDFTFEYEYLEDELVL